MKRFAYICGPFTNPVYYRRKKNILNANAVSYIYWKRGYAVLCPHTNSGTHYGRMVKEDNYIEGYLKFISALSESLTLVILPGVEKSSGSQKEIALANTLHVDLVEISPSLLKQYVSIYTNEKRIISYNGDS
jgi:hypothetical protein